MGRCSLQGLRYLWRVVRGVAQCGGRPSSMAQKSFFKDGGPKRRNLSSTRSRHAIAKSLLEVRFA